MELREVVSKNLVDLRRIAGFTQLELAEKLNYSDKAVSKWERGESLPDVETLKKIADLYCVSVDCLLSKNDNIKKKIKKGLTSSQKFLVVLLASALVWILATITYVLLNWFGIKEKTYLCFIFCIPVMLIVDIVFNGIWGKPLYNFILCSSLLWSIVLCLFLVINVSDKSLCFTLAIPIQIAFLFWYILRVVSLKKKKENNKPQQ